MVESSSIGDEVGTRMLRGADVANNVACDDLASVLRDIGLVRWTETDDVDHRKIEAVVVVHRVK
jgi:hypothetical protein